jgi:hypothetical protein
MRQIKAFGVRIGLALATWGGWTLPIPPPCALRHLPSGDQIDLARRVVAQVGEKHAGLSGPLKAREAQRMLLNIDASLTPRQCNLLIELGLA